MRSLRKRLTVLLTLPTLLVLGACASADAPATSSASDSSVPAALRTVKVTGDPGSKPTVQLGTTPTVLDRSGTLVLKQGEGPTVAKGQRVTVDYVLVNGKNGKEADTSFGKSPANFVADPASLMAGLANGLVGQKVGARLLTGVAPKDGFGPQGNQGLGFGKDDALIFVIDVKGVATPLKSAEGDPVTPPAGLPKVTVGSDGTPVIAKGTAPAPAKTVVQPLIKGKGAVVKAGQTVKAAYVGQIYATGKVFDSSYKTGQKLEQVVGQGGLIPGFDKGLVGQTVGTRVLLVIPPAEGYGKQGQPQAGIKGTDTLVFVVDILDAY